MSCGGIFPIKEIIRQSQTAKSSIAWQAKTLLLNMSRKSFRMQASIIHKLVVSNKNCNHIELSLVITYFKARISEACIQSLCLEK